MSRRLFTGLLMFAATLAIVQVASASALTISPSQPKPAIAAQPYSLALKASGGTAPYRFSLAAGALPPGIAISESGVISGTPESAGTAHFTVGLSDTAEHPAQITKEYTLPVHLGIAPTKLPSATAGYFYSAPLSAIGGPGPATYTVVSGHLPPGLELTPAGSIRGTPTEHGTFDFRVKATEMSGEDELTGERNYSVQVGIGIVWSETPPERLTDESYTFTARVEGTNGVGSVTITISSKSKIPPGMSYDSETETLSGTPEQTGKFNVTLTASLTEGGGSTAAANVTLNMYYGPVGPFSLTTESVPFGCCSTDSVYLSGGPERGKVVDSEGSKGVWVYDGETGALKLLMNEYAPRSFGFEYTGLYSNAGGTGSGTYTSTGIDNGTWTLSPCTPARKSKYCS